MSYTATDNTGGATATAKYVMMVHDPYEKSYPDHTRSGIENVHPAPNSQYVRSTAPPGQTQDLNVYSERSDSWAVSASAAGPLSEWIAEILKINLEAQYTATVNVGQGAVVKDVPGGYATYLEYYEAYDYHWGKADTWSAGGYTGTQTYWLKAPSTRAGGCQAHMPLVNLGVGP